MTTETPRPEQIQANVAAALSRLRGELAPSVPGQPASAAPGQPTEGPIGTEVASSAEPAPAPAFLSSSNLASPNLASPSLTAPDPSMALNPSKPSGDTSETPFGRITGLTGTEQPDLLAGIGAPPLADIPDAEMEAAKRRRRFRNRLLAGGVLVIALAGFWFWSGGGESGNEPVPVITADSTPEKVKPADEGGLDVPNQDVAILNGENSNAPTQGETVLPAPEQPATPPTPPEPAPEAAAPEMPSDTGNGIPTVAAPAVDAIPTVPAPTVPAPTDTASADSTAPAETQTATAAPAEPATTQPAAAEPAAAEAAPAAAPAATGSARIQLAAVKSEAAAQKEWARLQKANPDLLGGLSLHVERFNKTASEVYYRIQAGPLADKAAAKQLCAKLKQNNQACIVAN
ncbi:SPOR domain-containing protein [Dongia sp.]|uniref:SPOR domain-containing protein n=1 Tax=Dongia sp. TaxID=1977262 RepID=UPI0035AE3978